MCNTDCRLVHCCVFTEKQESHAMAIFALDDEQTCFLRKKRTQIVNRAIVETQAVDT